ncbi:MAG: ribonuclease catalytic domain-containing protein [Desulfobulbaceae bacterium]|nr:ribonuclease catalytic domain-containing protein [Desulfobulbaceae bacterium]
MTAQGRVGEYIEHGKFICALVLEDSGKRLHLLNQNGREVSLSMSRLVHLARVAHPVQKPREELLRELKGAAERRQEMMGLVDLASIWELASEEPETLFEPRFLTELAFGEDASDDHVAAFLRCIFVDRFYFKYKDGRIAVHSPEVVEQLRLQQEKERRQEALLVNGGRGLRQIWDGEGEAQWPEREACLLLVADYYLHGNEAEESAVARELLKRAELSRPHDPFHLLVKAGVWAKNENIPLLRQELPVAFGEKALAQAAAIPEPTVADLCGGRRRDLTGLPLLTIDGAATLDYDDALHIEKRGDNFLVGIHISDVAHYVRPGDPLFAQAVARMTSLYFPELQVPMLPPSLSQGVCSLIAGRPRAAVSFLVLLAPDGEVLDFDLVASVVTVKRQLTYPQADGMMESDEELRLLAMLSRKLQQRRVEAGALLLPIPDVNIRVGADGDTVFVELAEVDTASRTLVAEFMILANTLGAQYVAEREIPGLYRCQEPPRQRLFTTPHKDLFLNYRQRRQLAPGQLLTKPKPHSGVGVPQYTTVTSPIRRLLDLVMQQQISHILAGRGALHRREDLNDLAATILTTQSRVNLVRQQRHRYWLLKYLEPKAGQRVEALVIDRGPKRVQVVLADCLLDGDLPSGPAAQGRPGEVVKVRIERVSALDNMIRFEW